MFVALALLSILVEELPAKIEFKKSEGLIEVLIDGDPFTTLHFADRARPHLYPVYGPTGKQMLRNYPFVEGIEGEEADHPHHTGVWFGHGDINGVDIWHQDGSFVMKSKPDTDHKSIMLELEMLDAEGEKFGKCFQLYTFAVSESGARIIDVWMYLMPVKGQRLIFGDTKEGAMGVRTHPNLRLSRPDIDGKKMPVGNVVNSEGVSGSEVWGKRAKWIDYWGEIDGETVGIAMFDHPNNPRHPTWWHAREYGLFAANPFGISAFEGKPAGAGKLELEIDEKIVFKYTLLLHTGTAKTAGIEDQYERWTNGK